MPAPGAHDLLIETHACGLNPIDFKVRRGALARDRPQPIILGFDAWFRAWTQQEERIVLNAVLYPTGSAIPAAPAFSEFRLAPAHSEGRSAPLSAAKLPAVANRPVRASGAFGGDADVIITVKPSRAAALRRAARAKLPARIRARAHFLRGGGVYALVIRGVRTGDNAERSSWEAPLLGALAERKVRVLVGQL